MTADTRGKTGRKAPPEGTRFKPGKSGNPSGRPKTPEDVKAALKELTMPAITRLGEIIRDGSDENAVMRAINTVLDRNLGKAPDAPAMDPFENLTEEQLVDEVRAELERRAGGPQVAQ